MSRLPRLLNRMRDLAFVPPLDRLWRRGMRGRVTCLLYHRVTDPEEDAFLARGGSPAIRPTQLARELRFLRDRGARFATFEDLRSGWFPAPDEAGVIVSFDDGFRSNYRPGLDVLDSVGIRAVFFQVSGMVEASELLWEHELYWRASEQDGGERLQAAAEEAGLVPPGTAATGIAARLRDHVPGPEIEQFLERIRSPTEPEILGPLAARLYPTAAMIREARDQGHEVGSHGHRHYKRATIGAAAFEADVARSAAELTGVLGSPPAAFSYPFNSYRPGDDAIVGRHFVQAITVDRRRIERGTDPLWLPRYSWPGPPRSGLRERRWLSTGTI